MADRHFGVIHSLKSIIDADSKDENEMNNTAPVTLLSELRNIRKSRRSYLDIYSYVGMNNKMDDIEQLLKAVFG
ncbi:hypothetical protein TNCV_4521101 [Trichonephila clavipes]|nr:hypothetical protein TNCV_4521101 [Trichonephila clavipes]